MMYTIVAVRDGASEERQDHHRIGLVYDGRNYSVDRYCELGDGHRHWNSSRDSSNTDV